MPKQRKQLSEGEFWADKFMDLANLSVVALVFGQLVVPDIRWPAFGFGLALYILIAVISKAVRRRWE